MGKIKILEEFGVNWDDFSKDFPKTSTAIISAMDAYAEMKVNIIKKECGHNFEWVFADCYRCKKCGYILID